MEEDREEVLSADLLRRACAALMNMSHYEELGVEELIRTIGDLYWGRRNKLNGFQKIDGQISLMVRRLVEIAPEKDREKLAGFLPLEEPTESVPVGETFTIRLFSGLGRLTMKVVPWSTGFAMANLGTILTDAEIDDVSLPVFVEIKTEKKKPDWLKYGYDY